MSVIVTVTLKIDINGDRQTMEARLPSSIFAGGAKSPSIAATMQAYHLLFQQAATAMDAALTARLRLRPITSNSPESNNLPR